MSLSHLILRHLTVLALTDKTLAGKEVRSSLLEPINEVKTGGAVPMIAIFTDSGKAERSGITGLDMMHSNFAITLALEIACVSAAPIEGDDGIETFIPQTDEGLEMTIDIIERQAIAELQCGDGKWADLWRTWAMRVSEIRTERGASVEKGVRFAARRVEITCEAISDPTPGEPLPPLWEKVFGAFAEDPRVSKFVPLLLMAASGDIVDEGQQVRQSLGLTFDGLASIAIAPIEGATGADPVLKVTIGDDDNGGPEIAVTADGATITEHGTETELSEVTDGD